MYDEAAELFQYEQFLDDHTGEELGNMSFAEWQEWQEAEREDEERLNEIVEEEHLNDDNN